MTYNVLEDAALHYAELKWRVIPLHDVTRGHCPCKLGKDSEPRQTSADSSLAE